MKTQSVYDLLNKQTPGVLALFDPDRIPQNKIGFLTEFVCEQGVNAILIGTSLLKSPDFDVFVKIVKKHANKPVILFPGGSHQVSPYAHAIFFLSLLSSRNPEFLISEQVKAVFTIKKYNIEVIPVGYLLIEAGNYTTVEYISDSKPIPRSKPEIAVAHAMAAQYFGMKYVYLEAGSGAKKPVPMTIIKEVKRALTIPMIVGGGIKTEKQARSAINAGADFIVLGSIIEHSKNQFKRIMRSL